VSLTSELDHRTSPVACYLRARFPHVREVQRRYREPVAEVTPLAPADGAAVAWGTVGGAFDWRVRFLLTPTPDLHLALLGALHLGDRFQHLTAELFGTLPGEVQLPPGGPVPLAPLDPPAPRRDEERLARACYALALYTEVFRAGLLPGSRLLRLRRGAGREDLLALASGEEVADLLALTEAARRVLLPALAARSDPLYLGPTFAGSLDVGGADADAIAGGLLVDWKVNLGDRRRDGRRRCSLELATLQQLLGYLLLDYPDTYRIDTLGVYAARYAYLATWPVAELLAALAGGPVDVAEVRGDFQQAATTLGGMACDDQEAAVAGPVRAVGAGLGHAGVAGVPDQPADVPAVAGADGAGVGGRPAVTAVRVGLAWLLAVVWVVGGVVCFLWGLALWHTALGLVGVLLGFTYVADLALPFVYFAATGDWPWLLTTLGTLVAYLVGKAVEPSA
jgi:hypothetical protein